MALVLLQLPELCRRRAQSHESVYDAVRRGLLTPPVKRGRSSAWPEHEVEAVTAATIAGKNDDDIRDLVKQLVAQRAELPQLVAEFSCPPLSAREQTAA